VLELGIDLNLWPWIWLTVAVIFAILELTLIAGTFILAPFAISALFASLLGFYDVNVEIQWSVFVFGGAALFYVFYRWARRFVTDRDLPPGVGADRLVGMQGTAASNIPPQRLQTTGSVRVEGEIWRAVSTGDEEVAEGALVEVVEVRGTRIVVQAVPADRPGTEQEISP
jgi:membrane protein implicated in regulation of membrane protease activity